jgi:hypothetical protein
MSKKIIKIAYCGMTIDENLDQSNILLLRIIEAMSNSKIRIVPDFKDADMILAYPYGSGSSIFKVKWFLFQLMKKTFKFKDTTIGFRWILGVGSKPTLFISHENLDRPYWWHTYGSLLINSRLPRLTYWPQEIDASGERFPYWYNYVDWPDYPRSNFYSRYGKLYSLDALIAPLKEDPTRKDEVILIASHLDFPRASILDNIRQTKVVKVFGNAGTSFNGGKYSLMEKYKYALSSENSVGFGYDSEKIPEAWIAGCIPVGVFKNPYSEFNQEVMCEYDGNLNCSAFRAPLLLNIPNLRKIEQYVKNFVEEHLFGNANLSR